MNERIKQLASQARNWGYAEHSGYTAQLLFEQKFAELIVRECGQWVNDNLGLLDEEARADLLKHFGVKK
jgi:hypothetical protein